MARQASTWTQATGVAAGDVNAAWRLPDGSAEVQVKAGMPAEDCKFCRATGLAWVRYRNPKNVATGEKPTHRYVLCSVTAEGRVDVKAPHNCRTSGIVPAVGSGAQVGAQVNDEGDEQTQDANTAADMIARGIAALASQRPQHQAPALDVAEVERISGYVATSAVESFGHRLEARFSALEQAAPRTIEVKVPERPSITLDERTHPQLPILLAYATQRRNVYCWGAPGGGKTHAQRQVARALGLSWAYMSLTQQTSETRVFGYQDANGTYRGTDFERVYRNGGIMIFDEYDNVSGNLATGLNAALDNHHAAFPGIGVVERHPDTIIFANGNTPMRGGSRKHASRIQQDAATAERFIFLEWKYDEAFEDALAAAECGVESTRKAWVSFVRAVRAYAADKHPDLVASPRASIMGLRALADLYAVPAAVEALGGQRELAAHVAESVMFKGLDRTAVNAILAACPLPRLA